MASGTVLVTGASTGIGEATVAPPEGARLRRGRRRAQGRGRRAAEARGVRTVRLDVTDAGSIAAARDELGDVAARRPREQRRHRRGGAARVPAARPAAPAARDQPDRPGGGDAGVPPRAARAARGRIVNGQLDRRPRGAAAGERLQRLEVRARGDQRLAAARAALAGRRRDPDRARRREDADLEQGRRSSPTRCSRTCRPRPSGCTAS